MKDWPPPLQLEPPQSLSPESMTAHSPEAFEKFGPT